MAGRALTLLAPERPLKLVDLATSGTLARAGADSRLFAGEHSVAQQWSRAFFECPYVALDGILYPARHDPARLAVALFDRAPAIDIVKSECWHDGGPLRSLLGEILDHYGFELIETKLTPPRKSAAQAPAMVQRDLFET